MLDVGMGGFENNIALDDENAYISYTWSNTAAFPHDGGILALPRSGDGSFRVVVKGTIPSFWVDDGKMFILCGKGVKSLPLPISREVDLGETCKSDYRPGRTAHDHQFAYAATANTVSPQQVMRIPLGGGEPQPVYVEDPPDYDIKAVADADDSLLVLARRDEGDTTTLDRPEHLVRVRKDTGEVTEIPPDTDPSVKWSYPGPLLLAWNGRQLLTEVRIDTTFILSRLDPATGVRTSLRGTDAKIAVAHDGDFYVAGGIGSGQERLGLFVVRGEQDTQVVGCSSATPLVGPLGLALDAQGAAYVLYYLESLGGVVVARTGP